MGGVSKRLRLPILATWLCAGWGLGNGNFQVERVTIERGVFPVITSIIQDRRGFLWLGTSGGLWRYDGQETRFFESDPGDTDGLVSNGITALFQDSRGGIWIGTENGLNRYHPERKQFDRFQHDPENDESLINNRVSAIAEDGSGHLWIATMRGLDRFDLESEIFSHYLHDEADPFTLPSNIVTSLAVDSSGRLWAGTARGLNRFDSIRNRFENMPSETGDPAAVDALFPGRDGGLWVIVDKRLYRYDATVGTGVRHKLPNHEYLHGEDMECNRVFEDGEGGLWLASTRNGLIYVDPENRRMEVYAHDPNRENTLSFNGIQVIREDRSGLIWVGTTLGLNKILKEPNRFHHVTFDPRDPGSLNGNVVYDLMMDAAGDLWVATSEGLSRLPKGDTTFEHFVHDPKDAQSLAGSNVYEVIEDSRRRIWAGSIGGLNLLDPQSHKVKRYTPQTSGGKPYAYVHMLAVDSQGHLWLGGDEKGGIQRFDPDTETFQAFPVDLDHPHRLGGIWTTALFSDREGTIWIGTMPGGLHRYIPAEDRFQRYQHNKNATNTLSHDSISSIFEDDSGILWLTTRRGLNRFDPQTETFEAYFKKDGLPLDSLLAVVQDDDGFLWLSHDQGLTKYHPPSKTAINYDFYDGLNNKYFWGSYYKSPQGELYFGGNNGYNRFHPGSFQRNVFQPPVVLTDVYARANESLREKPIWAMNHIELNYTDSYIKFHVAALDYTNPAKNLFSYKLIGLDEQWSPPSTDNYISFTGLPPGDYVLRVMGSNNDGVWNTLGTTLKITVVPPLWRTTQAYVLYALLVPSLLFGGYRLRVRRLKARERMLSGLVDQRTRQLQTEMAKTEEQARKLMEMDRLKTQFFANVSHEFRTPLTLILGPLESMLADRAAYAGERLDRQHEVMLRNARRLLRLINQLLDLSKLDAGKMRLQARAGQVVAFLKPIVSAFQSLADKNRIRYTLDAPHEDVEVFFDREKLEKIMFNLLSNAFQFTPEGGAITVAVTEVANLEGQDQLEIRVSDTGVGIVAGELPFIFDRFRQVDGSLTRTHEGTGIGLALVKELVSLHKGSVHVESREGEGTEFRILLPMGREHLEAGDIQGEPDEDYGLNTSDRAKIEMASLEPSFRARPEVVGGVGETILVVDDNADVREYICDAFKDRYRVLEAVDGRQGLLAVQTHRPDLIICDIMMPVMDGYEMCSRIKADKHLSHIPIVLVTAKASDDMKVEGLEIGADDYLSKPFNVRELRVRVRNLLNMREHQRAIRQSLEMAHKAQVSMLPGEIPSIAGLEIAGFCEPAREVGGDYYDFLSYGRNKLGVVIGDVSGKGMPAALYMTMTKGLVQAYSGKARSPRETLCRINRQFQRASAANIFISLIYAIIDSQSRSMVFCSAGHNPMLLCSPHQGGTRMLKTQGMAIGLEDGRMFDRVVHDEQIQLKPGDVLLLYTDGVTEGMNSRREVFGEQRLIDILQQCQRAGAREILETIKFEHRRFVGTADQFDDMTAVVIKVPEAA